jgi:tetratricopeptide (TPR) repeat protein
MLTSRLRSDRELRFYECALAIQERDYGPNHRDLAPTLNGLGDIWHELGKPAKARQFYERALAIEEREYGPDHREIASTLINLGNAWGDLGKPAKARQFIERALAIQEREYGPDHGRVASTMYNLGSTWSEQGQPAKARQLYERGLSIARAELPESHPTRLKLIQGLRRVAPDLVILEDGLIVGDTGSNPPPWTPIGRAAPPDELSLECMPFAHAHSSDSGVRCEPDAVACIPADRCALGWRPRVVAARRRPGWSDHLRRLVPH